MKASAEDVIGVPAAGMLTTSACDQVLVPQLKDLSQQFGALRALFHIDRDFRGGRLSAAWANTKLDFRFRGHLEKVAIVAAPAWEEWCVSVAGPMMKGQLRTFGGRAARRCLGMDQILSPADGVFFAAGR